MLSRTRSSLVCSVISSSRVTTTSHGSITIGGAHCRFLGSRSRGRPRAAARRAALALDRRMEKAAQKEGNNKSATAATVQGEQVLSESNMKWGFFLTLIVLPVLAFGVIVSTTPELRQQFDEFVCGAEPTASAATTTTDTRSGDVTETAGSLEKSQ